MNLTLEELKQKQKATLDNLVSKAGNATHLARMLEVPPTTTQSWLQRGRISKAGALKVGEHPILGKHFKAEDLRPELINS